MNRKEARLELQSAIALALRHDSDFQIARLADAIEKYVDAVLSDLESEVKAPPPMRAAQRTQEFPSPPVRVVVPKPVDIPLTPPLAPPELWVVYDATERRWSAHATESFAKSRADGKQPLCYVPAIMVRVATERAEKAERELAEVKKRLELLAPSKCKACGGIGQVCANCDQVFHNNRACEKGWDAMTCPECAGRGIAQA